jgi:hypothetical protein
MCGWEKGRKGKRVEKGNGKERRMNEKNKIREGKNLIPSITQITPLIIMLK